MTRNLLAAAIAGAIAAPLTVQAVDLNVSGHVHRSIRFVDTGDVSDIQHVDDGSSRTRLRVRGSEDLGNGMKAGVYIEFGVASNSVFEMDIKENESSNNDRFGADIRHSALWFESGFGAVWMGQTSTASDGVATNNLVTGLADEVEWARNDVSDVVMRNGEGPGSALSAAGGSLQVQDLIISADGGRRDILRYDSPKFGPAQIKVAVGNDEFWDIGGHLKGSLGGGAYALSAGYSSDGDNACLGAASKVGITSARSGCEKIGLSGAYQFAQGTVVSASYSMVEAENLAAGNDAEADNWFVKLGHEFGNNEVSISYGVSEVELAGGVLTASADAETDYYGIAFQHNIPKAGVQLHAAYHRISADLDDPLQAAYGSTGDPDDMDVVIVGARVRFQ